MDGVTAVSNGSSSRHKSHSCSTVMLKMAVEFLWKRPPLDTMPLKGSELQPQPNPNPLPPKKERIVGQL
ncbi:hypothetical protein INR49_025981 [Caranx melampygus]|nr:hypothetical protein INR49_025981 [Caranx melampygus]